MADNEHGIKETKELVKTLVDMLGMALQEFRDGKKLAAEIKDLSSQEMIELAMYGLSHLPMLLAKMQEDPKKDG